MAKDETAQATDETSEDKPSVTRIDIEYLQDDEDNWGPLPPKEELRYNNGRCRATLYFNGAVVETRDMWRGLSPADVAELAGILKNITDARELLGAKLGADKAAW